MSHDAEDVVDDEEFSGDPHEASQKMRDEATLREIYPGWRKPAEPNEHDL